MNMATTKHRIAIVEQLSFKI